MVLKSYSSLTCLLPKCRHNPALYGHMSNVHKQRNSARLHVYHNQCPVCLKHFHDRRSIIHHILYGSKRCKDLIVANVPPMSDADCVSLDKEVSDIAKITLFGFGWRKGMKMEAVEATYRSTWLDVSVVDKARQVFDEVDEF